MNDGLFDIPVVLFIFRRLKAIEVMKRIAEVKPKKLYLLGDNGRTDQEKMEVAECRRLVENEINWNCEVIKNYATENRGVYENIGLGAKWVFEQEEKAIFLEDDNLPETTFFRYCEELLNKYEDDTRILWVCGTNYLGSYAPDDNASYMFTRHMLPCGWASWKKKFLSFYDGDLKLVDNKKLVEKASNNYYNKRLFKQYKRAWGKERRRIASGVKPGSWDYQMDFAIKVNGLYGIAPSKNQIRNIGVDKYSIHGGNRNTIMTKRFTQMKSYPLDFPLKHPEVVLIDSGFERKIYKIVVYPIIGRINNLFIKIIRKIKSIKYGK
ncbi:MAG: glycosyltransferase family 2 protein [Bacilli bacterium]|nr:glycosyltransferase family 2 protein [Bacilli bacterium]